MKVFFFIIEIFFLILVFNGCGSNNYTLASCEVPIKEEPCEGVYNFEYKIQPQDRLLITSYKFPEVTQKEIDPKGILVNNDGYINLPLINKVHLAGLTQAQAARLLETKYSKYLKNPSFNVEVMNKRVYVLGEVNKPGVIKLDRDKITILEAISFAGDLTTKALRNSVIVISRENYNDNNMKIRKVDLTSFRKLTSINIIVKPNDIIYVPPNTWKKVEITSQNISNIIGIITSIASPYLLIKSAVK